MAGDAGALAGFIDGAAGGRVTLFDGHLSQRAEAFALRVVGREGGVERRLEDLIHVTRQEAEGFAHEVLTERAQHRGLAQGDGDLTADVLGDALVVLRHGQGDEEFVLLQRAGVRQQGEVGVPLRGRELGVGQTRGGVHAQTGAGRIDEEVGEQFEGGVAQVFAAAGEREERLQAERGRLGGVGGDGVERGVEALVLHVGERVQEQRRGALGELGFQRGEPVLGVHLAGLGGDGAEGGLTDGDLLMREHPGDALGDARLAGQRGGELT